MTILEAIYIADPILIVILLFMFIPFILKVQSTMERIYLHICQFNEGDIKKWLDACNNSASDIKASITTMQNIYQSEVFEINFADYEKKGKQKEQKKDNPNNASIQNRQDNDKESKLENKFGEEEDEKPLVAQAVEITVSERKKKTFSQMSKEKTKTYLFYLIIFGIYIGGFKIADGLLLQTLESEADKDFFTLSLFHRRTWDKLTAQIYFRENMIANQVLADFERIFNLYFFRPRCV